MATAERKDPFPSFNFAVEIHGIVSAGFSEVAGLQAEITVQEYQEGGVNDYVHKFWGPAKYPANLVLKRGITDTTDLWSWYCDVMRGKVQRKEVSVVLMNSAGEEQRRWTFQNAYPVKWAGPGMRATASEVAVETLELAHEGLKEWRQK